MTGADRKLSRSDSYDAIHEIVLTLINDNRAMQNKVNVLSEKLEHSRFQIMRLRSSLTKAEEIGNRDGLTALGNRRFFDNALAEEVAKARDFGGELCIALADIDHFKKINDKFGHVAGDMVLKLFAELLMMNIKGQDKVARFGGEEFAILFPDSRLARRNRDGQPNSKAAREQTMGRRRERRAHRRHYGFVRRRADCRPASPRRTWSGAPTPSSMKQNRAEGIGSWSTSPARPNARSKC